MITEANQLNTIQCQGTYNTPSTRILYHISLASVQVLFLYANLCDVAHIY
nr:MAG TPA: hypothetical protein [Caudoviricetes sp.]